MKDGVRRSEDLDWGIFDRDARAAELLGVGREMVVVELTDACVVLNEERTAGGDEIKLTSKSDSGDFPGHDMTLKRVKPSAPAPEPAAAATPKP